MERAPPVTRAELELAVRAELVDVGATGWHARVAADYILGIVDEYLEAARQRLEERLEEVVLFYLGTDASSGGRDNPALVRHVVEDCHRVLCLDLDHHHEETSLGAARRERL